MGIKAFFKKAFGDMKESTKAQHEADKAGFRAAKAEAKANFEENKKGKIQEGMFADFVLLNENLFEVDCDKLKHVEILETYLGGKMVYK